MSMKTICVLVLCFLAGCAGRTTFEELEDEAIESGNWSKVEERERLMQRQDKKLGPECPSGLTTRCYEVGLSVSCDCVRGASLGRMAGRP